MAHRALVAYGRADERYDVYYAHWGAADLSLATRLSTPDQDPVGPEPLATGVPFEAVVGEVLDPLMHEALYVLAEGSDPPVRAYRVLWLGPVGVGGGLAVAVDPESPCDDPRVVAWFRGARALAAACRRRDGVPAETVATLLEEHLRDWAGDREVLRLTGG